MRIGIDFGMEYCRVGFLDSDGVFHSIGNSEGELSTPSAAFFYPEGFVCVGASARQEGALDPDCLCDCVKSKLGDYDYRFCANGGEFSAVAVSFLILKKLIADAELISGEEIEGAVITCPAYFGMSSRAALKYAAENVRGSDGRLLRVLRFLDEPIAAAIAYGKTEQEPKEKTVLIYDLGGTFDCTVVKCDFRNGEGEAAIVTIGGDHMLGGRDWDAALTRLAIRKFCDRIGADEDTVCEDIDMRVMLSENIERAKKRLSRSETVRFTLAFDGIKERIEITREELETETKHLLDYTITLVDKMLEENDMSMDDIDEILLVGGAARMPQVAKRLESEYHKPIVSHLADTAVVMGAAMVADSWQNEFFAEPCKGTEPICESN